MSANSPSWVAPASADTGAVNPELNPLGFYRHEIAEELSFISGIEARKIFPLFQRPQSLENGDFVLPVPALRVKGEKPGDLAARWAEEFPETENVKKPTASGPLLVFFLQPASLFERVIPSVHHGGSKWGFVRHLGLKDTNDPLQGSKRIVIEFSSPNIAKNFHQGHLRSTIIGGFLSNLYEACGWDVVRLNYLGDWGKQYGLLALGFKMFGDTKSLDEDPIHHLYQVYVKINNLRDEEKEAIERLEAAGQDASDLRSNGVDEQARQYFKAMCDGEPEAIEMWKKFRGLSVEKYKQAYARLNIRFDEYLGESMVKKESLDRAERALADQSLLEESEGATIVDFTKHLPGKEGKSLGKALIRKKDGTSLYITRDLGALYERDELFDFDHMIYVVAADQELHLKQLFKLVELAGRDDLRSRVSHISFGLVLGMSTRRGTVVFLDDVLQEAAAKMHQVMRENREKYAQLADPEKTADILGISSVMVQDMVGKRVHNYRFDMEKMTSFEGDTGPYLQYSHARLCSIFAKVGVSPSKIESANLNFLTEPHAAKIVRLVAQFPDVILQTMKTHEPTTILTYLFRLTHVVNSAYGVLKVVGSGEELMLARLALFGSARIVLGNGMRLLGLTPLERM